MKTQTIGERLRELRESRNLTQLELADSFSVSDKTISKWEKDGSVPDTETLVKFAEFYDVTLDYLITGNTTVVEKEAVSKIELAAREDNIALLDGVDLKALDDKGFNIEYYAKKYNAQKIADHLMSAKFEEIIRDAAICKLHHITALPKGSNSEDDRVLIAWGGSFERAPNECAKAEKEGWHAFKVFRELGMSEENNYDGLIFQFLVNGFNKMEFELKGLDDHKSGLLHIEIFKNKTYKLNKKDEQGRLQPDYYPESKYLLNAWAYVKPSTKKDFIDMMNEVDFKSWKSKSWGCAIHEIWFSLKDAKNTRECEKNYIDPGKEKYTKFAKEIEKLAFESLQRSQYITFMRIFDNKYVPYQRENVPFYASQELFRDIEIEMEEEEQNKYLRGDLLLKNKD